MDAVRREMKEETGLDILKPRFVGIKQFPIDDGRCKGLPFGGRRQNLLSYWVCEIL